MRRGRRISTDPSTILIMPLDRLILPGNMVQDRSLSGNNGSVTNNGGTGNPIPQYPGFKFTATSKHLIDIGNAGNGVKSILAWIKPVAVNVAADPIINLNGSDSLAVANGTLTTNGLGAGQILYTDSVAGATTITTAWHHIAVTTTAGFNATGLKIGQLLILNFNGLIGDVILSQKTLTPAEIKNIYSIQRHKYGV